MNLKNNNILYNRSLGEELSSFLILSQIEFDLVHLNSIPTLIVTVDSDLLPISWFVTCSEGKIVKSGVCIESSLFISLAHIEGGEYTLRMKGEKFVFSI